MSGRGGGRLSPGGRTSERREEAAWLLLGLPLLLFLALPVGLLAGRAGTGRVIEALSDGETRSAVWLSLLSSSAALGVAAAAGTPLAYWLARTRSRLGGVVETLVDLPTVLPPSVAGVALLLTLGRNGPVGGLLAGAGIEVAFTPGAVVLAQVFVASPYFVRAAREGFASVDADLVEAAVVHGATGWGVLRRVVMPLASRSIGAGAAMCWSRAVGEFGATIIFAGNLPGWTQTMPLAVYLGFENGMDRALALSAVLIGLALAVLVGARALGLRVAAAVR